MVDGGGTRRLGDGRDMLVKERCPAVFVVVDLVDADRRFAALGKYAVREPVDGQIARK